MDELNEILEGLTSIRGTLAHLTGNYHGDHRPECPILGGLESLHLTEVL